MDLTEKTTDLGVETVCIGEICDRQKTTAAAEINSSRLPVSSPGGFLLTQVRHAETCPELNRANVVVCPSSFVSPSSILYWEDREELEKRHGKDFCFL